MDPSCSPAAQRGGRARRGEPAVRLRVDPRVPYALGTMHSAAPVTEVPLTGDVLDTIHAQAQSMWDVRQLMSWLHGSGATQVGSESGHRTSRLSRQDEVAAE